MNTNQSWLRLEVWFVVLSVMYALLVLAGAGFTFSLDTVGNVGNPLVNFLGLFVPVGPNNFTILFFLVAFPLMAIGIPAEVMMGLASVLTIALVAFVGIVLTRWVDKSLKTFTARTLGKVILNFLALLLITTLIDMVILFRPMSILIFFNSIGLHLG